MEKYELKTCPFCGSEATICESYSGEDGLDDIWVLGCVVCPAEMTGNRNVNMQGYGKDEKEDLIEAWNKRV